MTCPLVRFADTTHTLKPSRSHVFAPAWRLRQPGDDFGLRSLPDLRLLALLQMPPIPPNDKAKRLGDYLRVVVILHFVSKQPRMRHRLTPLFAVRAQVLALIYFVLVNWLQGVFDIIGTLRVLPRRAMSSLRLTSAVSLVGCVIGYMGIRNPQGYNFQSIMCYMMYCGMEFIWATVRAISRCSAFAASLAGAHPVLVAALPAQIRMILFFASQDNGPSEAWKLYMQVGVYIGGPIIYVSQHTVIEFSSLSSCGCGAARSAGQTSRAAAVAALFGSPFNESFPAVLRLPVFLLAWLASPARCCALLCCSSWARTSATCFTRSSAS